MENENKIKGFKLNSDDTFTELPTNTAKDKANELIIKFGELAIDVVIEILDVIEPEDNIMYFEIHFWTDVYNILIDDTKSIWKIKH
jgi:hypothetical protein